MAERKITMPLPDGKMVEAIDIQVLESTERWSDFTLVDGTKFRAKVTVTEVQRALNEYDPLGQPWYRIQVAPLMTITEISDALMKKEKKEKK